MPGTTQYDAQKKIAVVWFIFSAVILVVFVVIAIPRSIGGTGDPLEWLVGYLSPGLTLIASVFVYSLNNKDKLQSNVIDPFFVKLIRGASFFYLFFIFIILLLTPLAESHDISFADLLKKFSPVLSFVQAIVLSLLGIFFIKQQSGKE